VAEVTLVDERRHDEAEDRALIGNGLLEGGSIQHAGGADDRFSGHADTVFFYRPDLHRDPELDPDRVAVDAVMPFQFSATITSWTKP
jgi:hypothetical protein